MVKIAIKIGVLVVVLVVIYLGYNLFIDKATKEKIQSVNNQIATNRAIGEGLALMLNHKEEWPEILKAQKRDIGFIRTVLPRAPFDEKGYLTNLLHVFRKSGVHSSGVRIIPARPAAKHVDYYQFFTKDLVSLAMSIESFHLAFEYLKGSDPNVKGEELRRRDALILKPGYTDEELELALWYSFRFNQLMSVRQPEGVNLLPGLEMHRFETSVRGSYDQIKYFLWLVKKMRPHTVIVNWHMSPGAGIGPNRPYNATLGLITFVDTNTPPNYEHAPDDPVADVYKILPDLPNVTPLLQALGFV